jgi:hypothetical protein
MGPTPFALESDHTIIASITMPQPTLEMKKGFLNLSGLMKRNGTETTQKMMNPTIS